MLAPNSSRLTRYSERASIIRLKRLKKQRLYKILLQKEWHKRL